MADIKVLFNNLDTIHYEELNIPEILAQRDELCFHDNWVRVFVQIQVIKQQTHYPVGRIQISDTFRKRSFQKIYKYTSDMGLCGSFNQNIYKVIQWYEQSGLREHCQFGCEPHGRYDHDV